MPTQTTAGAARARRAGLDPQRLSHRSLEPNPALVRHADQRAKSIENRVADRITAFAGSMPFVQILDLTKAIHAETPQRPAA